MISLVARINNLFRHINPSWQRCRHLNSTELLIATLGKFNCGSTNGNLSDVCEDKLQINSILGNTCINNLKNFLSMLLRVLFQLLNSVWIQSSYCELLLDTERDSQ